MLPRLVTITGLLAAALYYSCRDRIVKQRIPGLWKVEKIELHNKDTSRVIDTSLQYWQFNANSAIEIFNNQCVQNVLHIKMSKTHFASYNDLGELQDEYLIKKYDNRRLELSSPKRLLDQDCYIYYYLDKVDPAEADTLREQIGM